MSKQYQVHCECGTLQMTLSGEPRVKGFCHCEDCRDLLDVPFHAVTAWNEEQINVVDNQGTLAVYQHPRLEMQRIYCVHCGETLYNTNAMGWRVVSQLLISKCNGGILPDELRSDSHFFYARRVIDIDDDLPKDD